MSSAHNIFKFSRKQKTGRKARNTKLKRKQMEHVKNESKKTNFQCEIKAEEIVIDEKASEQNEAFEMQEVEDL